MTDLATQHFVLNAIEERFDHCHIHNGISPAEHTILKSHVCNCIFLNYCKRLLQEPMGIQSKSSLILIWLAKVSCHLLLHWWCRFRRGMGVKKWFKKIHLVPMWSHIWQHTWAQRLRRMKSDIFMSREIQGVSNIDVMASDLTAKMSEAGVPLHNTNG